MRIQGVKPVVSLKAKPVPRKTSFVGDVLKLVFGTVISQLLGVLVLPILTRLYAPEAFGLATLFTSIISILGVIACLRYELAIVLPEGDEEAANLLGLSLLFTVLISLLTVALIHWGKNLWLNWLNASELEPYLWLVAPAVFIVGVFQALNYWNSRTRHFERLSIARVSQSVVAAFIQLSLGVAGFATGGTVIGANVSGQALAATVLGGQIWRDDRMLFLRSINGPDLFSALKRHRKFPLYDTWSALLNAVSWQLPALLLSSYFSSVVVGYYALGFRLLHMPMSLIGGAINQVFFQRAAEAKAQGTLPYLAEEVFQRLVVVGIYPMLMMAIIGGDLFSVVFGPTWAEAGVYAQILAIWTFFWFISSPISVLFSVLEKQEFGLKFNMVLFSTRFVSLAVGSYLGNARLALLIFAGTGALLYGYLSFALLSMTGVPWFKVLTIIGHGFLRFLPFGAFAFILSITRMSGALLLLSALALTGGYAMLLWRLQPGLFRLPIRKDKLE